MKVGNTHLTYCTNVHAGESWPEVLHSLKTQVLEVKAQVCPNDSFGIGLRLSAVAARTLSEPEVLEDFQGFLQESNLYVFTLNGFPYGPFHGQPVKAAVYRPDWQCQERSDYTQQLVNILSQLVPEGLCGSISTVPGAFRPEAQLPSERQRIAQRLGLQALCLRQLLEETGCQLSLSLEPEPCCMLETTPEAIAFFEEYLLSREPLAWLAKAGGISGADAELAVREHLGICLDTCHAAIEFEQATDSLRGLAEAGLQVSKIQASTGLSLTPSEVNLSALAQYDEQVYLHQVVAKTKDGKLLRYLDLPQAFACKEARQAAQWRVHFHVPVHQRQLGDFSNTQQYLVDILHAQRTSIITRHIEVETYTWDVLPVAQRAGTVTASVARELLWVKDQLTS